MGFWASFYSLLTLVMFLICAVARFVNEDADRVARAASWVTLFAALSRIVGYFTDQPLSLVHYPAIDLFMLAMSFGWWQVRGERWAWLLGCCFLSQLVLHAWFWSAGEPKNLFQYILLNNLAFATTLAILATAGGGYVARWVIDRLRMFGRRDRGLLGHGAKTWA